jgi:hypothetical protein
MKKALMLITCLLMSGWGQSSSSIVTPVCPMGDVASDKITNKTFNCIHEWSPCDASWWSSVAAPVGLGNPFDLGMGAQGVSLLTTAFWQNDMCGTDNKLKDGWVVYDRNLIAGDIYGTEPANYGPSLYFSLYNKNSGVLQTFFW